MIKDQLLLTIDSTCPAVLEGVGKSRGQCYLLVALSHQVSDFGNRHKHAEVREWRLDGYGTGVELADTTGTGRGTGLGTGRGTGRRTGGLRGGVRDEVRDRLRDWLRDGDRTGDGIG